MNIQTSNTYAPTFGTKSRVSANAEAFVPAAPSDLVSIGNSFETQDRFDGGTFGKAIGGMFGAGVGAAGGAAGGAIISALAGASGWGVAASTVGGLVGGVVVGAYLGSR